MGDADYHGEKVDWMDHKLWKNEMITVDIHKIQLNDNKYYATSIKLPD